MRPGDFAGVGLLAALLASACSLAAQTPAVQDAQEPQRHVLAIGESADLGRDVRLKFDDVVRDSRCPKDVQCITAGYAEIAVTLTAGARSAVYHLCTPEESPGPLVAEGYSIELAALQPVPVASRRTPKEEYRAVIAARPAREAAASQRRTSCGAAMQD